MERYNKYPCKGCNEGWGQANPWGIDSCHETCKKYWNWIEEDKKRDKPLKDWTLGEIREECRSHLICDECEFLSEGDFEKYGSRCRIDAIMGIMIETSPCSWNLERTRWTEQDIIDAKMIKTIIPYAQRIKRDSYNSENLKIFWGDYAQHEPIYINGNLVPSLKATDGIIKINYIIGDEDNDN